MKLLNSTARTEVGQSLQAIFGLLVLAGLLILAVLAGSFAWDLAKDAPEVAVPLATAVGAFITAMYSKLMDRKREITAHQHETKSEIYDDFVHFFLTDAAQSPRSASQNANFNETHQKMLLWGSDEVIATYVRLFGRLSRPTASTDQQAVDDFISLILEMRKDLGYKNNKIESDDIFILLGKNTGVWEEVFTSENTGVSNVDFESPLKDTPSLAQNAAPQPQRRRKGQSRRSRRSS